MAILAAQQSPVRIYRTPADVLRDRRFGDSDRLEILRAWRISRDDADDAAEINALITEVEGRLYTASNHAAE